MGLDIMCAGTTVLIVGAQNQKRARNGLICLCLERCNIFIENNEKISDSDVDWTYVEEGTQFDMRSFICMTTL